MGAVFVAEHPQLKRRVAIKVLHPGVDRNPEVVYRFFNEAKAATEIRNEHIVEVLDFGELPDGVPYLVMEWLEGQSLGDLLKSAPLQSVERTASVVRGIAEALKAAHAKGVIHRDLKPDNVFLLPREGAPDFVKVLDFGIAKMMTDERGTAALTAVGQTLGTLEFMSPEQLRGQPLDGRSDIYALGIMAYEMLTGELPFKDAKTPVQIINFHMQKAPPPPSRLKPELQIPAYVDEVILKMVQKDREARHVDTNALRAHIGRVLQGADKRADRFEAYRVVGVVGAAVLIISALVYFLSR